MFASHTISGGVDMVDSARAMHAVAVRLRSSRAFRAGLAVIVVIGSILAAVWGPAAVRAVRATAATWFGDVALPGTGASRPMCAQFTDAAGLYPGNKVLLLGVEVGVVTSVVNESGYVRIEFTIPASLDLPADVGAASYSDSVVTNRSIELSKPYAEGPKFVGANCIALASTRTPVTVSDSFTALNNLADTIMDGRHSGDPATSPGVQAINDSLQAAARSLQGTGGDFRRMLNELSTMVGDPHQADAEYRELFANSAVLTSTWLQHWDSFSTVLQTLPAAAELVEGLSRNFSTALNHLVELLPVLVDTLHRFSGRVYHNISDKLVPFIRDLLGAYTPHLVSFFTSLPPVINWLANDIYEPNWATHNVTYVPPQVAISPDQAAAICQGLRERGTPGANTACAPGTAADPVTLGLTNLIMGGALS